MGREKKKYRRLVNLYAELNKMEYDKYKYFLKIDHLDSIKFLTKTIRQYIVDCEAYYESLLPTKRGA